MNALLSPLLEVDGVTGALLLSHDGLPVATANLESDEAETIGALTTALLVNLRTVAGNLTGGSLTGVNLICDDGTVDVRTLDDLVLLVFRELTVDTVTLDTVMPEVDARCREFAL